LIFHWPQPRSARLALIAACLVILGLAVPGFIRSWRDWQPHLLRKRSAELAGMQIVVGPSYVLEPLENGVRVWPLGDVNDPTNPSGRFRLTFYQMSPEGQERFRWNQDKCAAAPSRCLLRNYTVGSSSLNCVEFSSQSPDSIRGVGCAVLKARIGATYACQPPECSGLRKILDAAVATLPKTE
jgi:hypothetical protein